MLSLFKQKNIYKPHPPNIFSKIIFQEKTLHKSFIKKINSSISSKITPKNLTKKLKAIMLNNKIIYFFLLITLPINIFLAKNTALSLYGVIRLIEFIFLGFYISHNIASSKQTISIITLLSLGIVGESLIAIFQYINQGSLNGFLYFFGERHFNASTPGIANASIFGQLFLRPYATFPHPNTLAGYLLIVQILVYSINHESTPKFQVLKYASLIISSIAILLTLSRLVIFIWLCLIIYLIFETLRKHLKSTSRYLVLFISISLIILFLLTPALPRLIMTNISEEAVTGRLFFIKQSIKQINQSPFFGVGLYNFIPNLIIPRFSTSPLPFLQPVHNIFLLILSETGIMGFLIYMLFLAKTFLIKNKSKTKLTKNLHLCLVIILILGQIDHYWITLQQTQLLFALILGLIWSTKAKTLA